MKSYAKCNKFQMLRSHTSIALIGCKYTKVFLITGNYAIFLKTQKQRAGYQSRRYCHGFQLFTNQSSFASNISGGKRISSSGSSRYSS